MSEALVPSKTELRKIAGEASKERTRLQKERGPSKRQKIQRRRAQLEAKRLDTFTQEADLLIDRAIGRLRDAARFPIVVDGEGRVVVSRVEIMTTPSLGGRAFIESLSEEERKLLGVIKVRISGRTTAEVKLSYIREKGGLCDRTAEYYVSAEVRLDK